MMSNVKTKPAKKLTKSTTDSLINYGIVIVLYIIMMIMQATGNLSSSTCLSCHCHQWHAHEPARCPYPNCLPKPV